MNTRQPSFYCNNSVIKSLLGKRRVGKATRIVIFATFSPLKKKTVKILSAIFLLLCFATGQIIVVTHAHTKTELSKQGKNGEDNCKICQLSHAFTAMMHQHHFSFMVESSTYTYVQPPQPSYHRILLLFAFDRGPPAA